MRKMAREQWSSSTTTTTMTTTTTTTTTTTMTTTTTTTLPLEKQLLQEIAGSAPAVLVDKELLMQLPLELILETIGAVWVSAGQ